MSVEEALQEESAKWDAHRPLDGMVVTLDELREHVREHTVEGNVVLKGRFGKDRVNPGYDVYGREKSEMRDAHGCPVCESIVIGPPIMTTYNTLGERSGRAGIKFICANDNCNAPLGNYVVIMG